MQGSTQADDVEAEDKARTFKQVLEAMSNEHGEIREDDRMEMKIGKENGRDIKKILREGRKAWKRAGREERRFLTAEVKTWNDTHDAWHYGKARGFLGVRHRR